MRPGLSDKDKRLAFKVSGGALNLMNLETIDCPLPNCAIHRSAPALRNLQNYFHNFGSGWVLPAIESVPRTNLESCTAGPARYRDVVLTSWDRSMLI
jgi:hypothetical protein